MVLPIIAYGDPVLRKVATDISPDYPNLNTLIANMYDTMNHAYGVGLAAPQIGLPIRLFVVDTAPFADDDDLTEEERTFLSNFKKTFINAKILQEEGEPWAGLAARVVQHEYDHIEGILFTDKLSSFKKQLIKGKLTNISKGKVKVDYRMKFYKN